MVKRNLDHLVLVTNDLDQNRVDLTRFGFFVAADGVHPFGTKNACVFFQDGTYFEPVAIHNAQIAAQAAAEGNAFVQKFKDYTGAIADKGFSGMALTSDDVSADHTLFKSHDLLLSPTFSFSRGLKLADGSEKTVSFHINFVDGGEQDQFLGFAIQREVPLPDGKNDLTIHPNGVVGIQKLYLQSQAPEDYRDYLAVLTGDQTPQQTGDELVFEIGERSLIVSKGYATSQPKPSLNGVAIELKVINLDETKQYLHQNKCAYIENGQKISCQTKALLGYNLIFSE